MYRLMALVVGLTAMGCTTDLEEACHAGEFPAVCATLRGTVEDMSGTPLPGLTVGPRYSVEECLCTTEYGRTDEGGRYSFRIAQTVTASPDESWPDTLALYVAVGHPDEGWIDSVLAPVVFDPTAIVHEVNVVLER